MNLLHLLSTLLLVGLAASSTHDRAKLLKDLDNIVNFYTACAEPGRLSRESQIPHCIELSNFHISLATSNLPKVRRFGDEPLNAGTCKAISDALKKPFDTGKQLWDFMQKKELLCLIKKQKYATQTTTYLEGTTRNWNDYLSEFDANCNHEQGVVFYAYQEWKEPSEVLAKTTSVYAQWETTCAAK